MGLLINIFVRGRNDTPNSFQCHIKRLRIEVRPQAWQDPINLSNQPFIIFRKPIVLGILASQFFCTNDSTRWHKLPKSFDKSLLIRLIIEFLKNLHHFQRVLLAIKNTLLGRDHISLLTLLGQLRFLRF